MGTVFLEVVQSENLKLVNLCKKGVSKQKAPPKLRKKFSETHVAFLHYPVTTKVSI